MHAFPTLRRAGLALALVAAPLLSQAAQVKSAVWWNEAESGWGLFIADQGNVLAPFWFTNDADGEPVWFNAATIRQADGSYRGDVLRITGTPLAQIVGQAADPAAVIGTASLRFEGETGVRFDYTVNGQTQSKTLTRFAFGDKDVVCDSAPVARANASNYSDIWWNPDSSGWGVHISHVETALYTTWYTYDTDREPIFYQGLTEKQADGSFTGPLYRTRNGTPFNQINGAPANAGADQIGTVTLRFSDGQNASYSYTIGNVTQTKSIQRFQFGDTAAVCSVKAFGSNTGGNGSAESCWPPYAVGDVSQIRISTDGGAFFTEQERITGSGTFQGQTALIQEVSDVQTTGTGVKARNYLQNGDGTWVSLGSQAFDPSSGALQATSVNQPLQIARTRSFTVNQAHELVWRVNSTASGTTSIEDLRNKVTFLGKETVTVPAGTFEACKFAEESDLDSSTNAGGVSITTRVRRTGTRWTSPQFGLVKFVDSGTAVITGPVSISQPVSSLKELMSATIGGVSTR